MPFRALCFGLLTLALPFAAAAAPEPGLLFYLSGDHGTTADFSAGHTAVPNFDSEVSQIPDGARGGALRCGNTERLTWWAPGNIYAQRGTLSFFWRPHTPVGPTAFPVFRVGYADHSSWDMVFLRIDYNGHGFDAFVTDASLTRTRVSVTLDPFPSPDTWIHLALAWDETQGLKFYVNGKLAAAKDSVGVLNAALDQFGPHCRIISPWNVQSDYNFVRGGDLDELRIYDHMVSDQDVGLLAGGAGLDGSAPARDLAQPAWKKEWDLRYGWNTPFAPPGIPGNRMSVRKVEIHDAYDLKRWWWKATDGIRETTWPGVYNRSRLPGRNDYFQLPDWDCYSLSGKSITFTMPDEPWNQLEISGAAWGTMTLLGDSSGRGSNGDKVLFERPQGLERSVHTFADPIIGKKIRFDNVMQEQPIGELSAFYVTAGLEPTGSAKLDYTLAPAAAGDRRPADLVAFVEGRNPPDERTMVVAVPAGTATRPLVSPPGALPVVHLLIPSDAGPGYALDAVDGGLDGIVIDLPALAVKPTRGDQFLMNVQVKDPLWPLRDMMDFTFSVKPGEAKTLWLDLRDRILPPGRGIYLTLAGAGADFSAASLQGAHLRLIFKPKAAATAEHALDRFTQARDAYAMLVEEHPNTDKLHLWTQFAGDIKDLLRVVPDHSPGLNYYAVAFPGTPYPPFDHPAAPAGVPLWAFRQVEALGYVKYFVNWWIDHRQVENGEYGGGLSDDTDLTNMWPGVALMGVTPEKISAALKLELNACYREGMFTNGLCSIQADELHGYEEGINCLGQNLILNYGSPRMIERAMETSRGIAWLSAVNPAGRRLFQSSFYNGLKMATDSVWGYSKSYEYLILQPQQLLVDYNGNPQAKAVELQMADGLLAHRRIGPDGHYGLPGSIHFADDREDGPARRYFPWPLFWSAYKWTGDRKYLDPIFDGGATTIETVNANLLDLLDLKAKWGPNILRGEGDDPERGIEVKPHGPTRIGRGDYGRWTSAEQFDWQLTGDKHYLEVLYDKQIREMELGKYINTEGSLWIDRVGMPYAELQRARLGGVALTRNNTFPGHVISWKFEKPANDQSVAILVPRSTPTSFKVIVYNLDEMTTTAEMTGWNVDPGIWTVSQGTDPTGLDAPGPDVTSRTIAFGRSQSVVLKFPPRMTTVLTFDLKTPGIPYWQRPDLGIDPDDILVNGREVLAHVHSLGSVPSPATPIVVRSPLGKVIATEMIPPMEAPNDLKPRTVNVRFTLPEGSVVIGCTVEIDPDQQLEEITRVNNKVTIMPVLGTRSTLPAPVGVQPVAIREDADDRGQ